MLYENYTLTVTSNYEFTFIYEINALKFLLNPLQSNECILRNKF